MLGIANHRPRWRWAASGKHPSARDFVSIGNGFPLASGFAGWVTKGYNSPSEQARLGHELCSWRFWTRGEKKGDLACGLLRDSSDSVGRPFPLLIIGTGYLPSWEEHWDLLPLACEGTWRQMEYVSAQKFNDLGRLEGELLQTRPPSLEWRTFSQTPLKSVGPESPVPWTEQRDNGVVRISLNDTGMLSVPGNSDEILEMVISLNRQMRNNSNKAPGAFFLGGTLTRSFLVLFHRPLCADDFTMLWLPKDCN